MMDLAWSIADAIHLEIGEPDFTAPPHVVEAATRAMRDGKTHYPPTAGLPELREAVTHKLERINGITAASSSIVITNGGCQGLFGALSVVLEEGDSVALPDPGWPNYRSMAGLLGAVVQPYTLPPQTGHVPDPEEIDRLGAQGCKAIVLNNPANPLGTVAPEAALREILSIAGRHGMWIVSDECYDELSFIGMPSSPAALNPHANVITAFSFSKSHAMTGWRVGYVVAQPEVIELVARAQEPLVMGINTSAQYGAMAALEDDAHVSVMREEYRRRRDAVVAEFRRRGRDVVAPSGAFYLWLDVRDVLHDDRRFVLSLLENEHVAIAPGSSFGEVGAGFVRLSLAVDEAVLLEAVERIDHHLRRVAVAAD
jgi:aspartate aminotransferase